MANEQNMQLCDKAAEALGTAPVCAITDHNVSGISSCSQVQTAMKECGIFSTCMPDPSSSFSTAGGYIHVHRCETNKGWLWGAIAGGVCLGLLVILAIALGVVRPAVRSLRMGKQAQVDVLRKMGRAL